MIWCVADRRRRSYIRALHTRFYRELELWSTRAALEHTCRKIRGRLGSKTRKFCYSWRIGRTNCGWRPPWYLYRRVSAGHGDCWGTGALFFRRRGRKASHRVGENRASPRQRLIWYTKRKSCRWQLFLKFLITVAVSPGCFFSVVLCVVEREADAMAKKRANGEGNIRKRWPVGRAVYRRA